MARNKPRTKDGKPIKTVKDGKVKGMQTRSFNDYLEEYYENTPEEGGVIWYYDQILNRRSSTVRILNGGNTVIKGIYKDDFHVGIQNQWQSGGPSMLKMIVDTAASYITGRDAKMIAAGGSKVLDYVEQGNTDADVADIIASGRKVLGTVTKYSNSHIFSADDYFKAFKGTSVTFPTNLSITLLTDNFRSSGRFKDVISKLKRVLNVSIGAFENFGDLGIVGIQNAPNGFASGFANIGDDIVGGLDILFGDEDRGGYRLTNMVISSLSFVMSKVMVDVSDPPAESIYSEGGPIKGSGDTSAVDLKPLFIDVQVSFEPARMMTLDDIKYALKLN